MTLEVAVVWVLFVAYEALVLLVLFVDDGDVEFQTVLKWKRRGNS